MCAYGSYMDRLNDTRPVKTANYNQFLPDGHHDLVVCSIEPYQNQEENFCVRATFLVESSTSADCPAGNLRDAIWNLDKVAPFPGGERDKDRFAAFLNALQGVDASATSHQGLARACLMPRAEGGQLEMQPCRGARIKAVGYTKQPKMKRDGVMSKPFCQVTFTHVPQDQAAVAAMRGALDTKLPYTPRPERAPQAAPAPAPVAAATPAAPNAGGWVFPPK